VKFNSKKYDHVFPIDAKSGYNTPSYDCEKLDDNQFEIYTYPVWLTKNCGYDAVGEMLQHVLSKGNINFRL